MLTLPIGIERPATVMWSLPDCEGAAGTYCLRTPRFVDDSPGIPSSIEHPSAVGGSMAAASFASPSWVLSYIPKKNSLSLSIGPPMLPPKRPLSKRGLAFGLLILVSRVMPCAFCWVSRAFKWRVRINPEAEPWNEFVPRLGTGMNFPPGERAHSAWYWFDRSENSDTASGEMYTCGPVTDLSLLSTPSTTKLLFLARWPPTEPPVPTPTPPVLTTLGAINARL